MKRLVTLIVPVWNQLDFTKKMLSSLKTYTSPPYELIIINNASTDGTNEYLAKEWADKPHVTIIHNKSNLGWTKAINQGFRLAKGNYIGILNNDILFTRGWLDKMLVHLSDPAVGAVGPTSNFVSGRQLARYNAESNGCHRERANYLIGFCVVFKKELIDEVGEFDELFSPGGCDEIDYAYRIRKTRWKMEIARDVFIWHSGFASMVQHPGLTKELDSIKAFHSIGEKRFINKWSQAELVRAYDIPPKVLIVVPHKGYLEPKHYTSMILMEKPPLTHMIDIPSIPIQMARNFGIQTAQQLNAEYVFFIDSDAIVTQDLLVRLLKHGKDITGIIAYTRNEPHFPCVFNRRQEKGFDDWASMDCRKQGLVRVDGLGMHACLIHSRVFNELKDPWFKFDRFGEDLTFMEKAKQAGFEIWCDTDITLLHIGGPRIIGEADFLKHKASIDQEMMKEKSGSQNILDGLSGDPRRKVKLILN